MSLPLYNFLDIDGEDLNTRILKLQLKCGDLCDTNKQIMEGEFIGTVKSEVKIHVEMFYLNSTLNFGIPPVLVFQLEVYYKVDKLLTGLTAQQKGTTAQWYSNKTPLY